MDGAAILTITEAVYVLREQHDVAGLAYNPLYRGCLDGRIPCLRSAGRIFLRKDDLPAIAAVMHERLARRPSKPKEAAA
jgi:hypothetical protein